MPYFISNDNPDCNGWAVEKEDREVIGCHRTRAAAIDQMVAVSIAEGIEPGGERPRDEDQKAMPRLVPPQTVRDEAEQGLRWRREYGRGGTAVGVARARDLANGRELSIETIRRMISFFARHAVDLEAPQNNDPQADGYPGAGLIAWKLWGGTPGRAWAERMNAAYEREQEREDNARSEKGSNSGTT